MNEIVQLAKNEQTTPEVFGAKATKMNQDMGFDILNQLQIIKDKTTDRRLTKQQSLDYFR